MTEFVERLSSPTNPNGMFEDITSTESGFEELPLNDRVQIAVADIYTFAVEVAGLDADMAEIVTARAATEAARAINPDIAAEALQPLLLAGIEYARDEMVERAIGKILH